MKAIRHIVLALGLLGGAGHALYTGNGIVAYRVANGLITVDGKVERVWKEIGGTQDGVSVIDFRDYRKVVLLADSLRNRPPESYYAAPDAGSVAMLAAYDQSYLYFLFLVRENDAFNPAAASCSLPNLWKAHAVDVFVDPSTWSESLYTAYFSIDAGEASYGTSPKTVEVAKPVWPGESREFYRDRTVGNTFQVRSQPPTQVSGASAVRLPDDSLTFGVEIRIPITAADYPAGKSMFISWGYNHYPDPAGGACDELPIAYRWARHEKSYEGISPKPPGWVAGDSVHFDPLQSYDGWGKLELRANSPLQGTDCRDPLADTEWDLAIWKTRCGSIPASFGPRLATPARFGPAGTFPSGPVFHGPADLRDLRGRRLGRGSSLLPPVDQSPAETPNLLPGN